MVRLFADMLTKYLVGILSPKKTGGVDISKYTFLILAILPLFVCFFGMKLSKSIDSKGIEKMERFYV